jgi:2-methylisocitrate lyase-like PEP mutase family enzyme
VDDLDNTIARLQAFVVAGADAVYAPGLADLAAIGRVVAEVDAPVNVLALAHGPSVPELASVGVRRVSTGGARSNAAYGALVSAATELLEQGTSSYTSGSISRSKLKTAFAGQS